MTETENVLRPSAPFEVKLMLRAPTTATGAVKSPRAQLPAAGGAGGLTGAVSPLAGPAPTRVSETSTTSVGPPPP